MSRKPLLKWARQQLKEGTKKWENTSKLVKQIDKKNQDGEKLSSIYRAVVNFLNPGVLAVMWWA